MRSGVLTSETGGFILPVLPTQAMLDAGKGGEMDLSKSLSGREVDSRGKGKAIRNFK